MIKLFKKDKTSNNTETQQWYIYTVGGSFWDTAFDNKSKLYIPNVEKMSTLDWLNSQTWLSNLFIWVSAISIGYNFFQFLKYLNIY